MSIQDVLAQAPAKVRGTTRVVVRQEVFDYKAGAAFVAVVHPASKVSFMVEAPQRLTSADTQTKHAAEIALKKAIWKKFQDLRKSRRNPTKRRNCLLKPKR